MAPFSIRRLTSSDAEAYRAVRLDGLLKHPEAFGSSYEDEASRPIEVTAERLDSGFVLGAFDSDEKLMGVAGLAIQTATKAKHKGTLWGMYVLPEARGTGLSRLLVDGIIAEARGKVERLLLTVVSSNAAALSLYRKAGFVEYGLEQRALRVDDAYFDEMLMALPL
ncbi:GNAT family N-acetyltransferase [Ensifer adhaerens]|uniref:Putative acetyltransferase protein n=1 Tax=Ensifer adhaerens TaxID=106592 RepID=I0FX96_ENSAD|nr:GNAT family N-acetyltransferase [Ensifer sp. ENS08]KSV65847.1 hypothetical protein N182_08895 [Sinorhizobium sp. GL2]MBD9568682.1 GNAT family N-acetyltransferase [Ensifer sp. ENS08]OKP64883.1 hypothetical protein BTE77_33925 [Ensifer adhaerens]BAL73133.1 putative acetyltransferase protein [Ensifer adhaerens]